MLFMSLLCSLALAVPQQLSQQGRLLDSSGAAIQGTEGLTFRIYDSEMGGNMLWEEIQFVDFVDGYYAVTLGANLNYPLEDSILALSPIYLEVELNSTGPFGPRQQLKSAPYARRAQSAESIDGGTVDASELFVNGSLVVDGSGAWVGPTINLSWGDILNVPADLADGDDDTLASLSCNSGQIVGWNGANWICTDDNGLTETEVENYITNAPIDLAAGSMVGGDGIVTTATDQDSLGGLNCVTGDVPKWDAVLGAWACDTDIDTDTDTVLSESQVEGFVANDAIDLAAGSSMNGRSLVTSTACNHGEFLSYDANLGQWNCQPSLGLFDMDSDGVMAWDDCDDNNPLVLGKNLDADCDGILTADDCNDSDPNSTAIANDADCDGALTADDCDDNDAYSTVLSNDADCDGSTTANDCNDNNPLEAPGLSEICGDGLDNDCSGGDATCATYIDSYTGGGQTVYKMSQTNLPGGNAASWYQSICESVGLRPVSCDPNIWGSSYNASSYNAVILNGSHYGCNVSSGIQSLTGWNNIITFHVPSSDQYGVCENGCSISGSPVYPICTDP